MNMFQIKVIAIASMIVDHFGLFFFPHSAILHIIGRLSFPLIAWLIANGARHTHSIDTYLQRLLVFACISQIPYEIGFYLTGHHKLFLNVLFTLFFGLLAIRMMRTSNTIFFKISAPIVCAGIAMMLNADYGAAGVLSIVAFYIFFDNKLYTVLSQTVIFFLLPTLVQFVDPQTPLHLARAYLARPFQGVSLLALPILFLYNEKRGLPAQYFFYWFFPLQSFAILALSYWW